MNSVLKRLQNTGCTKKRGGTIRGENPLLMPERSVLDILCNVIQLDEYYLGPVRQRTHLCPTPSSRLLAVIATRPNQNGSSFQGGVVTSHMIFLY